MPDDTTPAPLPQGRSYMWIGPPPQSAAPAQPPPVAKAKPQRNIARPKMPAVPNMSRRLGAKLQRA